MKEESKPSVYQAQKNRVLKEGFKTSDNFYKSDRILKNYLRIKKDTYKSRT